ncbi:MAG TPA: hypothetical protein VLA66_13215, partial [Thermoanaerobaculia bacterium]|nr:hypothetical protein [Thermoanaerobaculia bacterium]
WEMVRRSRRRLPEAWISLTTNAHARFRPEMIEAGLDEIICSIAGVDQASYEPYRLRGRFDLAWRFLTDFARAAGEGARKFRVVWKYILFEHNSSPENLLAAQRMALDAGISELTFVFTRNGPASRTLCAPEDVPRLDPGPPLSFRFHEPAIADLEARLAAALSLRAEGCAELAGEMAVSVRRNISRFFAVAEERPERQRRLIESLDAEGLCG